MDPQRGNETTKAMDCVLESAEQLATSPCASMKDFSPQCDNVTDNESAAERSIDANISESTVTVTHLTASGKNSRTIHQNAATAIIKNGNAIIEEITCASTGSSTLSAHEECNEGTIEKSKGNSPEIHDDTTMSMFTGLATNAKLEVVKNDSKGINVKSVVDGSHDDSCSESVAAATDIDIAIKNHTSSKDTVIARITLLAIDEEKTSVGKHIADTVRIDDHALIACSDPAHNMETNDHYNDGMCNSEENRATHEMKYAFPPDCKMVLLSGKSVKPSNKRDSDSHYDSEIEIIDCTSEGLDDQPVAGGASPRYQSSIVANTSGSGIARAGRGNPRNKKRERYQSRCENLRQVRLKMKSGDVIQPAQTRSRVSSHSLDKLTKNNLKFMENFDPKMSNRERRKMMRKTNTRRHLRGDLYGANGELVSCGKNLCDCMNPDCPGCHFPCPRCQSPKCGHECRVNRKWTYEEIEIDGTDIVIRPHELIDSLLNDSQ